DRYSSPMKNGTGRRAFIGLVTSIAFLWALTLSVSPRLHERIHPDANRGDHSCAVTFVASGKFSHSPAALLISAPAPTNEFKVAQFAPRSIGPFFLIAAVLEHAPPAQS